ncbi:MAG: copper homeostasis membrane protein CopD [Novosphingobium sp.]|nr:copper homeostasis membrane protein CopD [Novosphingobium sp.]
MPEPSGIEPAVICIRLVQYAGAAALMGSSLLFVYAVPGGLPADDARRARRWIAFAAALLAIASLLAIALQGSLFGGSLADGFTSESFMLVASSMSLGTAALVRAGLAALACLALLALPVGRAGFLAAGTLGTLAAASLAWLGHGASRDGWLPIGGDVLHVLAASLWIGALFGFAPLLRGAREEAGIARLRVALDRFSALGLPLVAVLALSGAANTLYVVGPDHLGGLPSTPYGRLLLAKLAAFAAMLALAALNRWRLTPALARREGGSAGRLRASVGIEAALGAAVLALVAWLGTLEPFV